MRLTGFILVAFTLSLPVFAADEPFEYDPYLAQDINRTCGACHGINGQGGGGGSYPRLAGMSEGYIVEQLLQFKDRRRENIPMIPFVDDRDLPPEDIRQIAYHLSKIELQRHLPPQDPDNPMDGLERLRQADLTLQIPREPGDVAKGEAIYQKECAVCHGRDGYGRRDTPMLAGQHIKYLRTQVEHYKTGARDHEDRDLLFQGRSDEDWRNFWAYVSILDD